MEHTLDLTDSLIITDGGLVRSGNNIKMSFNEIVTITVVLDSAYFIKRAADRAYMRTNYP